MPANGLDPLSTQPEAVARANTIASSSMTIVTRTSDCPPFRSCDGTPSRQAFSQDVLTAWTLAIFLPHGIWLMVEWVHPVPTVDSLLAVAELHLQGSLLYSISVCIGAVLLSSSMSASVVLSMTLLPRLNICCWQLCLLPRPHLQALASVLNSCILHQTFNHQLSQP